MEFTITAKHIRITDTVRQHVAERVMRLPRYYTGLEHVEVLFDTVNPGQVRVEIIGKGKKGTVFVASKDGQDLLACVDTAVHKLERQLTRKKGIQRDHRHTSKGKSQ